MYNLVNVTLYQRVKERERMINISDLENKLSYMVEMYMNESGIPGAAVGIVINKELVYTKGFGVKNIVTGEPVKSATLFHMASISKTFVATAIMQLVEKGKLDINRTVTEYLPYFKLEDGRYKNITVQQMLSHISGMPDVDDYEWDNPQYNDDALENYTKSLCKYKLMWEPGEKAAYSNMAYEVLGDVISKVSGMTFENYIKENILNPLGMYESSFLNKELSRILLASPHVLGSNFDTEVSSIFPYNRIHAPSSTLCSNVIEMCNYATAYMNHGNFNGREIIKPETYNAMTKPYATAWEDYKIGFSWFLNEYKDNKIISHSGGDTGFRSNLLILPEAGVAVVNMCNCDYGDMPSLSKAIVDLIIGGEVKPLKISIVRTIMKAILESGIEGAKAEFKLIKEKHMDKYNITEGSLNSLGYNLLAIDRIDEAIEILKLAIEEFPNSSNLYDSIGEFYLNKGDKELAAINYKKSIELNPGNMHGISVLDKIVH